MHIVTKYAMLALFSASFIALNNCGNQSGEHEVQAIGEELGEQAADYNLLSGPPIGYPGLWFDGPFIPVEVDCNDGTDNDGDGLPDCMDNDCHVHPNCSVWGPPLEDIEDELSLVVYPTGHVLPETIALKKARIADDDDAHGWLRNGFFAAHQKDCWIDPRYQDPYFNIPLGEAYIAGPLGPVGPQLFPDQSVPYIGPRAGLIEECEFGTDLMFHHTDDDNGAGNGASGDTDDDEGGDEDDLP